MSIGGYVLYWRQFGLALAMVAGCLGLHAQVADEPPTKSADGSADSSQVRVVRISELIGHMQMDRGTGQGFEAGFLNLPVIEGAKVRTLKDSWTEIEFEDNSTLRLTPGSEMEFTALHRSADGAPVSDIEFKHGTMYLSLAKGVSSNFRVHVDGKTLSFREGSHVRLDFYPAGSLLVVVKGEATAQDATGTTVADKGKALAFNGDGTPARVVRAKDQQPGLYDAWDAAATQYHETHGPNGINGYGSRDLAYYGSFGDIAGCGRVWQPYFTNAAWRPYANGIWAWYPNQGYSFVSPYPWGWLPYHTGEWMECGPQRIWAWRPGGKWNSIGNQPKPIHNPVKPHPIDGGKPVPHPYLVSNDHHLTRSAGSVSYFFFARDSAGLDVPRYGLGRLDKVSKAVEAGNPGAPPLHITRSENPLADPQVALRLSRASGGGGYSGLKVVAPTANHGSEARPVLAGAHVGGGYSASPVHGGGGSYGGGPSVGSYGGPGASASASVHVSSPILSSAPGAGSSPGSSSAGGSGSSGSHK
jgi:hypothetical protein